MILVRMVCHAKIGRSSEVVAGFKKSREIVGRVIAPDVRARILTDLSGPFDTVILEMDMASLAEWERLRTAIFSNPQVQEVEAGMPEVIESGRTEYYTIEAA